MTKKIILIGAIALSTSFSLGKEIKIVLVDETVNPPKIINNRFSNWFVAEKYVKRKFKDQTKLLQYIRSQTQLNPSFLSEIAAAEENFKKNRGKMTDAIIKVHLHDQNRPEFKKSLPEDYASRSGEAKEWTLANLITQVQIVGTDKDGKKVEVLSDGDTNRKQLSEIPKRAAHIVDTHFKLKTKRERAEKGNSAKSPKSDSKIIERIAKAYSGGPVTIVKLTSLLTACAPGDVEELKNAESSKSGSGNNDVDENNNDDCDCRPILTWRNMDNLAHVWTAWGEGPDGLKVIGEVYGDNKTTMLADPLAAGEWSVYLTVAASKEFGQYHLKSGNSNVVQWTSPRSKGVKPAAPEPTSIDGAMASAQPEPNREVSSVPDVEPEMPMDMIEDGPSDPLFVQDYFPQAK